MRIKVSGDIISKTNINKNNYHHGTYAMILDKIDENLAHNIHNQDSKEYRLFTFSNIYMKENKFHIYISGSDNIINSFIVNIERNNIVRVEDMVLAINRITPCKELIKKDKYLLKGKIITTEVVDGKKKLLVSDKDINTKLKLVSQGKLKSMGVDGDIQFDILKKNIKTSKYRQGVHIKSYDVLLLVSGEYEAIKTIYEVGIGENTASGHGLLWEV
ncbi:MAG: CRISPR-associated endoribonuclease Cas6 [Paeniclostridium sordellii]|uniref:CRISPR-associated protein n=1 Tax=Paeniclostridium hominis TaxID=2764329 RepID=A0ABR7K3E4_9FIRM|nr:MULTISPECIES: CRISPR-associated endoribonuclease Cas6 [Paeniclostridium]MBC6003623.1 CRISPR-associated protein [Paeniclostridium hominis]MDU2592511.1 CRISPR-associated endoribonuclease Cas6 [Paeniclostridium sordellii]